MAKLLSLRCGKVVGVNSFCLLCRDEFSYSRKSQREAAQALVKLLGLKTSENEDPSLDPNATSSVVICTQCTKSYETFANLFKEYEVLRLKLNFSADKVLKTINSASNSPPPTVRKKKLVVQDASFRSFSDNLRSKIKSKVSALLTNQTIPKVEIERLRTEELDSKRRTTPTCQTTAVEPKLAPKKESKIHPDTSRGKFSKEISNTMESGLVLQKVTQEEEDFLNGLVYPAKPSRWYRNTLQRSRHQQIIPSTSGSPPNSSPMQYQTSHHGLSRGSKRKQDAENSISKRETKKVILDDIIVLN